MPPKKPAIQTQPDLPAERAIVAIQRQLKALENFKGGVYRQMEAEEKGWDSLTASIVERTFGNPSTNLTKFHRARFAGDQTFSYYGEDGSNREVQFQSNFEKRIVEFEVILKSFIEELRLFLPEEELQGAYDAGDEYKFYRDIKAITALAREEVFIVDGYLNEEIFDLYVSQIKEVNVKVRILTLPSVSATMRIIAEKYATGRESGDFEFRTSGEVHDRLIFIDGRCWVIGQSIKDAAKKKPTYIIEMESTRMKENMKQTYEDIWINATVLI